MDNPEHDHHFLFPHCLSAAVNDSTTNCLIAKSVKTTLARLVLSWTNFSIEVL